MLKNFIIVLIIILVASVSPAFAMNPFFGVVKKIIDGDSLLIVSGEKTIEVRLYGVDCPEYNQPFSHAAKALVRKSFYGKKVLIQPQYYDNYKRMVAIVEYGGQTLNGELVEAGLAWVYPRYCRKEICKSWSTSQNSAINKKQGIWSTTDPVSPWKWKRMKHGS